MQCNQKCFAQPGQTLIDLAIINNCNVWRLKKANKLEHCHLIPGQEVIMQYDNKRVLQRDLLKSINISIPILYMWDRDHIQGNLQICYDYLIFTVNSKKLSKEHKGKEDHLNFSIYVNEIYKIIFNPIAELMQIIIWGICGNRVPENQKKLLIELKAIKGETKAVKAFVREFWQMKGKSKRMITMEAFTYLIQQLQHEHESVTGDSFNTRVKKGESNIECLSSVYNFNYVEINEKNGSMEVCKARQQQQPKEQAKVSLSEESRIISMKQVLEIADGMPSYLQTKPWFLLFSINRHGSSYQEFLRRTEYAGPHVILIKDQGKKVFGGFLLSSWRLSKNEFFGQGESFLFICLYNHTRIFKGSQKNRCFQMADETGFSIGAGDKYGLFVSSSFSKGESNPSETFDNEVLSSEVNFQIQEFEVWGLDEEAVHQLKFQDQKRSLFTK
ncbi:unnamed protein product (macronuclear) [Paramecium tetraurelia]|uniref:Oxidation resistance protein 1 n=1 Tax=Paramecium tetraurelia TaxID=5888 RepID=A0BDM8_PARTE|nr:uncharacterized protein GSPATT00027674001 [Paramecium tetraurelia]CAK56645.1 unnamed protein product [Paramecium tetraurelia]|eukprot:XP_001424043.1 hypothetical protein (macronuclear) [Paramecium tetraurelia strain d4-2]